MEFDVNGFGYTIKCDITSSSKEEEIKRVFSYGNCHSLALAMHKLTGWPLMGVYRKSDMYDGIPSHVVVKDPLGRYVDVEGFRYPSEFEQDWVATSLKLVNPWHIRAWIRRRNKTGCGYRPTRVKDSIPFAEKVLKTGSVKG
jgi:hypothetical protein